jgi:hypothetical protein
MISRFVTTNNEYANDIFGDFQYEYYWKEGSNYEILVHDITNEKKSELSQLYTWIEDLN